MLLTPAVGQTVVAAGVAVVIVMTLVLVLVAADVD